MTNKKDEVIAIGLSTINAFGYDAAIEVIERWKRLKNGDSLPVNAIEIICSSPYGISCIHAFLDIIEITRYSTAKAPACL